MKISKLLATTAILGLCHTALADNIGLTKDSDMKWCCANNQVSLSAAASDLSGDMPTGTVTCESLNESEHPGTPDNSIATGIHAQKHDKYSTHKRIDVGIECKKILVQRTCAWVNMSDPNDKNKKLCDATTTNGANGGVVVPTHIPNT